MTGVQGEELLERLLPYLPEGTVTCAFDEDLQVGWEARRELIAALPRVGARLMSLHQCRALVVLADDRHVRVTLAPDARQVCGMLAQAALDLGPGAWDAPHATLPPNLAAREEGPGAAPAHVDAVVHATVQARGVLPFGTAADVRPEAEVLGTLLADATGMSTRVQTVFPSVEMAFRVADAALVRALAHDPSLMRVAASLSRETVAGGRSVTVPHGDPASAPPVRGQV